MWSGRLRALVWLGWGFVKALVKRRLPRRRSGLAAFLANYGADGLTPVSRAIRTRFASFAGCIACGRCDQGEGARMAASRGAYPGLMQLVLASSRSMPDYDAAARGFAFVPDAVLQEKTRLCPVGIPFTELAHFVRHPDMPPPLRVSPCADARPSPALACTHGEES